MTWALELKERETRGETEAERMGPESLEKRVGDEALLRRIETEEAICAC